MWIYWGKGKDVVSSELQSYLSIISLSIFADGYVRASEVESFMSAAHKLSAFKDKSFAMSDIQLLAWFNKNKIKIMTLTNSDNYQDWLYEHLAVITDKDDQRAILSIMKEISVSDQDYHLREKALISFIARYWNIEFSHA